MVFKILKQVFGIVVAFVVVVLKKNYFIKSTFS
jgi:hypothetical protein